MSATNFREYNVLFLCAHNSTRSILAECAMRRWSNGRFRPFSAGIDPAPEVNPLAVHVLKSFNYKTDGLRPKGVETFTSGDAPAMDFVFLVGAKTDNERCPEFPGSPLVAHWPIDDPLEVQGSEEKRLRAFRTAYVEIETRCKIFASLRVDALDRLTLQSSLNLIGTHHVGSPAGDAA